jgi:hypothetical protein
MRSAGVRAYEDRLGPLRGYRGVYAHLDPVELPSGLVPGTPEIVSERDLRLGRLRGANVDYPDVYRQACDAAVYCGLAEEALNLLAELDRHPGNRLLVLQRAAELRQRLDGMGTP